MSLPLGGTYWYYYIGDRGGPEDLGCGPAVRGLTVVNQGGLQMSLNDIVASFRPAIASADC